jgi:hypothetical protein
MEEGNMQESKTLEPPAFPLLECGPHYLDEQLGGITTISTPEM